MLTKRIIPCLDIKTGQVVKGKNFINLKTAGNPLVLAEKYYKEAADELAFLDITASMENRQIILSLVLKVAQKIFIPFSVGGGIKTIYDMENILKAGADKIIINTAAAKNPEIINQGAKRFGSQSVVLAIDAKKSKKGWGVYINGGREKTSLNAVSWAEYGTSLGAGEILLTSIDKDGTREGFDIDLINEVAKKVSVPIIASGGAGNLPDFKEVFTKSPASAALAASLFHYGDLSILKLKNYLNSNCILIRN